MDSIGFRPTYFLILFFLNLAHFGAGDPCKACYYRSPLNPAYKIYSCSDCDEKKIKEEPAGHPKDYMVTTCEIINKEKNCSSNKCILPGGPCSKDADCCGYPTIDKIYYLGLYDKKAYISTGKKSYNKCYRNKCRVDSCSETKTCNKQKCYIQNPTADKYFVSALDTCGYCLSSILGTPRDPKLGPVTGIFAQDGVILREGDKKCAYCSVFGGPCATTGDCCKVPYNGYVNGVTKPMYYKYNPFIFKADKIDCIKGRCVIAADSCTPYMEPCNDEVKPCCGTNVCFQTPYGYKCTKADSIPKADCPNGKGLRFCAEYGLGYCECKKPPSVPDICLKNRTCVPCVRLGAKCGGDDECCSRYTCWAGKCNKCKRVGQLRCDDDKRKCCEGKCNYADPSSSYPTRECVAAKR